MKRRDFIKRGGLILGAGALVKCSGDGIIFEPGSSDFSSEDNQICGAWSPNGSEIIYCSDKDNYDFGRREGIEEDYDIWRMDKDASRKMKLVIFPNTQTNVTRIMYPDWSSRDKIIFELAYVDESNAKVNSEIYVIGANGGNYEKIKWQDIATNLSYPSWDVYGDNFCFGFDGHIFKSNYPLQGMPVQLDRDFNFTAMPSWSPKGDKVAFLGISIERSAPNIYTVDVNSYETKQITSGNYWDKYPSWSRDGNYIIFSSDRDNGKKNIWRVRSDGSEERLEQLTNGSIDIIPKCSPDGSKLLYSSYRINKWGLHLTDLV